MVTAKAEIDMHAGAKTKIALHIVETNLVLIATSLSVVINMIAVLHDCRTARRIVLDSACSANWGNPFIGHIRQLAFE